MAKIYSIIIFCLLFISAPFVVHAAALSVSPTNGNFTTGERVAVKVVVTSDNAFNAVSGVLSIPNSIFTIDSLSKSNSVLNFWITEPVISRTDGTVKFEGIALGGYTGLTGNIITVNLRAITAGTGKVLFKSGQILANDGQGTDITRSMDGATYYVTEAVSKPAPSPIPTPIPVPTPPRTPVAPPTETVPEVTQPAPTLKAPEIMLGTKYGALSILGISSYPKADALVTFTAKDGEKVFTIGTSDMDGSFNILVPTSLKRGSYTTSAVMIKTDKTNSNASNTIIVNVGNVLSDIGWEVWTAFFLLLLAILYLLLRVHAHYGIGNTLDKQKLREAEEVVHKSFDILREDAAEYAGEKLSPTERKYVSEIKKDISEAEKIIEKKIKDIESE